MTSLPYRPNLALVHDRGYRSHADASAPYLLSLLAPLRGRLVLELGCGSGALTRHLVDAGHRVVATDASPAMLELARRRVPDAEDVRALVLPSDPLPDADAIVSVGHLLNYLPDAAAIEEALRGMAAALRPGGVIAFDLCDLRWGTARRAAAPATTVAEDWAIITRFSVPRPDRFMRDITTFVRDGEGTWRRDDERHTNVLVDTSTVPRLLRDGGVQARVEPSFGAYVLPEGLVAVLGSKESTDRAEAS